MAEIPSNLICSNKSYIYLATYMRHEFRARRIVTRIVTLQNLLVSNCVKLTSLQDRTKYVQGFAALLCESYRAQIHSAFRTQVMFQFIVAPHRSGDCARPIIKPSSTFYRIKYCCCDFSQLAVIHFIVRNVESITDVLCNEHFHRVKN